MPHRRVAKVNNVQLPLLIPDDIPDLHIVVRDASRMDLLHRLVDCPPSGLIHQWNSRYNALQHLPLFNVQIQVFPLIVA